MEDPTSPVKPQHSDSSLQDELVSLKAKYGSDCRILHNVGDFLYIITLKVKGGQLTFKFQIPDAFSNVTPEIIVHSPCLKPEQLADLQTYMHTAFECLGSSTKIGDIVSESLVWMEKERMVLQQKQIAQSHPRRKEKKPKLKQIDCKPESKKKAPMKTAEDVISRIKWDGDLPCECFIVGYLDRFTGIVEKEFTSLSWEDVASVDYNTLAIPKHRIQYFKYRDIKVWDKRERLDNVFGSTGSGVTIVDIMKQWAVQQERSQAFNALEFQEEEEGEEEENGHQKQQEYSVLKNPSSDHLSLKETRPTHFIAIRISDPEILSSLQELQNSIIEHQPCFKDCCIHTDLLHLTVCMLNLTSVEQISDACQSLEKAQPKLHQVAKSGIKLTLQGLSTFAERVVYAKILYGNDFSELIGVLKTLLEECGIRVLAGEELVPHVTILKGSQHKATRKIEESVYEQFSESYFGQQVVDALYLCEISRQRDVSGFFATPKCVDILS